MAVEFREPPPYARGSSAAAEIAAVLQDRPGESAVVETHPLPTQAGNEELARIVALVQAADIPYPAVMSSIAERVGEPLLREAAEFDDKAADKKGKAPRQYRSVGDVAKAVLREQVRKVRAKASSRSGVIKDGRVKPFSPAGTFFARSVTETDEAGAQVVRVYAVYLGPDHALPASEQPGAKRAARRAAERPPAFPEPAGTVAGDRLAEVIADSHE